MLLQLEIFTQLHGLKNHSAKRKYFNISLMSGSEGLGFGSDLLIANEIQTVKFNYTIKEQVANAV